MNEPRIERIVVVQAMKSTTEDHWYRALQRRLSPVAAVEVPAMPTPWSPEAPRWHEALIDAIGTVNEATLLVAHSVGNAAVLQYLTALPIGWTLGGLVNVAGFSDPQPGNDLTIPFVRHIDHDLVRRQTRRRDAVISTDDPEVPGELTARLAERLGSRVHRVPDAGHFRGSDGYAELPLVEDIALGMTDQIVATEPESTR